MKQLYGLIAKDSDKQKESRVHKRKKMRARDPRSETIPGGVNVEMTRTDVLGTHTGTQDGGNGAMGLQSSEGK